MRLSVIPALLLALLVSAVGLADAPHIVPAKRYPVGAAPAKAPTRDAQGRLVMAAPSITGGTLSVTRLTADVDSSGGTTLMLAYFSAGGNQIFTRQINIASGCGQITDGFGTVLAASTPPALCTAISTFGTQLDTIIANAAGAGKLNP